MKQFKFMAMLAGILLLAAFNKTHAQSVVSISTYIINSTEMGIYVTYSSDWHGTNGSINPDLAVTIQYEIDQLGGGLHTYDVTPILTFDTHNAAGQPVYTGAFDHTYGRMINETVISSVPFY